MQAKLYVAAAAILAFVAVGSVGAAQQTKTAPPPPPVAKAPAAAQAPKAMTWAGKISDSMCKADHKSMGATDEHKCTLDCVKGGSQYVFIADTDKKVYKIQDQKSKDLETHAGHVVQVTGTLKGDTITVTKIVMPRIK
jgi:hypothetical protein